MLEMESHALIAPAAEGLKVTLIGVLLPGASESGRETAEREKAALSTAMELIFNVAVPLLLRVTAWAVPAVPTETGPKLSGAGATVTDGELVAELATPPPPQAEITPNIAQRKVNLNSPLIFITKFPSTKKLDSAGAATRFDCR